MPLPVECRAHVIFTEDKDYIARLPGIPSGTQRVYFNGISLRFPEWRDISDIAYNIAGGNFWETVERNEGKMVYMFTTSSRDAMDFPYHEVYEEANKIARKDGPRLQVEALDREWTPF